MMTNPKCDRCKDTGRFATTYAIRHGYEIAWEWNPCNALPTCTAARDRTKEADDAKRM